MGIVLAGAYQSFEESFDGFKVLLVFEDLIPCLQRLVRRARGLNVTPKVLGGD